MQFIYKGKFKKFKTHKIVTPKFLLTQGIRLTIDYPEDLIICEKFIKNLKIKI